MAGTDSDYVARHSSLNSKCISSGAKISPYLPCVGGCSSGCAPAISSHLSARRGSIEEFSGRPWESSGKSGEHGGTLRWYFQKTGATIHGIMFERGPSAPLQAFRVEISEMKLNH